MKIVQINAVYGYGSTGLIVKGIEQAASLCGCEPFAVYQSADEAPKAGFKTGNMLDSKWHGLMTRVTGRQAYFSTHATRQLIKKLSMETPDVVHLHNLHSNYINLPMLMKYLADENIATVITLHDCWFFTGKCCHFIACGCDKWQTKCNHCPQNKSSVESWFVDASEKVFEDRIKMMQNVDNLTVVGCSKWITSLAERSPIFAGKKFTQIYNGVDVGIFKPKEREALRKEHGFEGKFVIMGMANKWLNPRNADVLESVRSNLNPNEVILLVGCTPEQQSRFEGDDRIVTRGFISGRELLADIYNVADVFVNLTFEDTLPTVNMEAICCGTPVITYDSCGSPELVSEGQTGYVIPTLDTDALQNAILRIKAGGISRENCSNIGASAFDQKKQYLEYISLYKKVSNKE